MNNEPYVEEPSKPLRLKKTFNNMVKVGLLGQGSDGQEHTFHGRGKMGRRALKALIMLSSQQRRLQAEASDARSRIAE